MRFLNAAKQALPKVISNVGVMVAAVDLPWLVCCQIMRGCGSLVLWIQASGRVMRSFPDKQLGVVLDYAGYAAHEFIYRDSDFVWTLEDEKHNAKANKPPKDNKPIACMVCGFVFSRQAGLSECGRVLPSNGACWLLMVLCLA